MKMEEHFKGRTRTRYLHSNSLYVERHIEKCYCLKVTGRDLEIISPHVSIRDHEVSDSLIVCSLNEIWKEKLLIINMAMKVELEMNFYVSESTLAKLK